MRFTADYDSEEEEFPVDDAHYAKSPRVPVTLRDTDPSSWSEVEDDTDEEETEYVDILVHHQSPSRDAWLAMYNKDKEISQLNALNAQSATKSFRNSLILEDLEAVSVADFLLQLTLDDQGRQKSEEEEIKRRNADVLDAIGKAISVTKARAEEKRRKEEEERLQAQRKLELERQKQERERQEKERIRLERVQALENARKKAEEEAAARKRAEEKRKQQVEEEARKKKEEKEAAASTQPAISSNESEVEFDSHLATIESIKSNVLKACSENPVWKKACFELKRKITSRLGQLTNSRRQISRLVRDLLDVFEKGKSVDETVLIWLLNFFSKQVIKQAESEVVVQIPSAYPLAYVCVFLMSRYSRLKAILLARFAKNCPWTVPFYDEPKTEESMKRMGYKRGEDDKWEETTRYIERQSGIFAVWIAMTTHQLYAKALTQDAEERPFPLSNAWRWASRTLNHRAANEIECAMMATFLEVVNVTFVQRYGRQGRKIVEVATGGEWTGEVRGPAVGRLEIMREEFYKNGRIGEEGFGAFVP